MRCNRGFTLLELLVVMGFIGITAAIALPGLTESTRRNAVWTSSELIGAQIRQARLKAISRNMSFRVRFNCPAVGQFRVLQVTGDAAIDNAADRCSTQQTYDTGVFAVNSNIYWGGSPPVLTVNSRGVFSSSSGIPARLYLSYDGGAARSLTLSATGQITFGTY